MPDTKIVYSSRVTRELCDKGFKVIKITHNPSKPWLNAFIFEETPELLKAFDEILTESKK